MALVASYIFGLATVKFQLPHYQFAGKLKKRLLGPATPPRPAAPDEPYWHDKATFFAAHAKPRHTVMLGDSLSDGAEWSELLDNPQIANRGIGGDTTAGILRRLDSVVACNPEQVFLEVGLNDFARKQSVDDVFSNYVQIVEHLRGEGITVHIQSTILGGPYVGNLNPSVNELNKLLVGYCSQKGLEFIDLNEVLAPEGLLRPEFTHDDIHLNGDGYAAWRDVLLKRFPSLRPIEAIRSGKAQRFQEENSSARSRTHFLHANR